MCSCIRDSYKLRFKNLKVLTAPSIEDTRSLKHSMFHSYKMNGFIDTHHYSNLKEKNSVVSPLNFEARHAP